MIGKKASCPFCRKAVASQSDTCPHCGRQFKGEGWEFIATFDWVTLIGGVALIVVLFWILRP
jgi:hypothetical protein